MVLEKVFSYFPNVRDLPNFHEMGAVAKRIEQITMHQKALSAAGLHAKESQLLNIRSSEKAYRSPASQRCRLEALSRLLRRWTISSQVLMMRR